MSKKVIGITVGTTMNPNKIVEGNSTGGSVHVGSDTPNDNATIWIDPNGEPSKTEDWEFEMEDGTTETKTVVLV